jgi:16S rRNA (adenine1518-N6/adenine1519-N6)-dimethyltransferase
MSGRLPIDKDAAQAAGFWTKKGLGQHLLRDPQVVEESIAALGWKPGEGILEIGPGLGALTESLLATGAVVLAIEVDASACLALSRRFGGNERFKLLQADVMQADLVAEAAKAFGPAPFHIAANLPYYITTPVLAKILESGLPFGRMSVLTQYEVAQRLAAGPGDDDYASLSVLAQYYCEVRLLRKVLPGAFTPPPKVDSALVLFSRRHDPAVRARDPKLFFKVTRSAFGKRRKTLRNALLMSAGLDLVLEPADLDAALAASGIQGQRRGETLSLQEFADLANALSAGPQP